MLWMLLNTLTKKENSNKTSLHTYSPVLLFHREEPNLFILVVTKKNFFEKYNCLDMRSCLFYFLFLYLSLLPNTPPVDQRRQQHHPPSLCQSILCQNVCQCVCVHVTRSLAVVKQMHRVNITPDLCRTSAAFRNVDWTCENGWQQRKSPARTHFMSSVASHF